MVAQTPGEIASGKCADAEPEYEDRHHDRDRFDIHPEGAEQRALPYQLIDKRRHTGEKNRAYNA